MLPDEPRSRALELTTDVIHEFESISLSKTIREAIRCAWLARDFTSLWVLRLEEISTADPLSLEAIRLDMSHHFTQVERLALDERLMAEYYERRKVFTPKPLFSKRTSDYEYQLGSITSIERDFLDATKSLDESSDNLVQFTWKDQVDKLDGMLERIRTRVYEVLVRIEQRLVFEGHTNSVFDEQISIVNGLLETHAPNVLNMFTVVYGRLEDSQPEQLHQAAASCRRILKSIADYLYPPRRSGPQERKVGEEQYINRLLAFASEHLPETVGTAWEASLKDLSARLDSLNALASKGVHASEYAIFEARHCALQTYLVAGDLLRLK